MKDLTKKNILNLKQSSTLVINEKCKELIKKGKKVYQFGFGQSPFPVPEIIVEELSGEDCFRLMIREQSIREQEPYKGQRQVYHYESPRFNRLSDAQLWGEWAITRWHQTDRFTAAGAHIRTDLDERGNPYGD